MQNHSRARTADRPGTTVRLGELLSRTSLGPPPGAESVPIAGVVARAQEAEPGSLFVAIRGSRVDGHAFAEEAVRRGAAAVVAERALETEPEVPVVRTTSSRRALAELAAAWYGRPAERLDLVGITGTVGKTSTISIMEEVLVAAGLRAGVVGSLGVHIDGIPQERTGYTAPDALVLHRSLAHIADAGCELAAMEVTSHALDQERVHGLRYDLGVFTSLIPLEHLDYHGSFRKYVEVKRRFLDLLEDCAPLVYAADNRAVRQLVRDAKAEPVGCGSSRVAMVRTEAVEASAEGTRLDLNVRRPLPRLGAEELPPTRVPLRLQLLGRSNVANAALAATASLCLGIPPDTVRAAVEGFCPPRRRMEFVHRGRFAILDDTVGHPDSVSALFEVVEALEPRRVHAVFAVRGQRGPRVNRQSATALAIWTARVPLATLVVTRSEEAVDDPNRVEDAEAEAFEGALRKHDVSFSRAPRLDEAVRAVLDRAGEGDLVLLLGAQGMDRGQEIAREWLSARPGSR